ncbi:hypothetical protein ACHAXS_005687 [Conticribra weissflogii]
MPNKELRENPQLEAFHDSYGRLLLQRYGAFKGLTNEQKQWVELMISNAVIGTDMANHFDMLDKLQRAVVNKPNDATTSDGPYDTKSFLTYLLHAADISSQAKTPTLSSQWIPRIFSEFFSQGDLEHQEGLPISPLCHDRMTLPTDIHVAQSQIDFIKSLVRPTYDILGMINPWVVETLLPSIEANIEFMQMWTADQRLQMPS